MQIHKLSQPKSQILNCYYILNFLCFIYIPVFASVEFYANWCQTCIEFQPKFKLMARNLNSLGVATAQVFFKR